MFFTASLTFSLSFSSRFCTQVMMDIKASGTTPYRIRNPLQMKMKESFFYMLKLNHVMTYKISLNSVVFFATRVR